MKPQPTWDELYDYVDSLSIDGDTKAQEIVEKYGYKAEYDMLYDFVDTKAIEGDDRAIDIVVS
jgi:hypothetical protein